LGEGGVEEIFQRILSILNLGTAPS